MGEVHVRIKLEEESVKVKQEEFIEDTIYGDLSCVKDEPESELDTGSSGTALICHYCGYSTRKRRRLVRHLTGCDYIVCSRKIFFGRNERYACCRCSYTALRRSSLRVHLMRHAGVRPHVCPHCDYGSFTLEHLRRHRIKKHGMSSRVWKCDMCQFTTRWSGSFRLHLLRHTGTRPHVCPHCDYRAVKSDHIKRHAALKHSAGGREPTFRCDRCPFTAKTTALLKVHRNRHDGIKPYACPLCDYRGYSANRLRSHRLTHESVKRFSCDRCDYRAHELATVRRHKAIHEGPDRTKSKACPLCDYTTSYNQHLSRHMVRHAPKLLLVCRRCGWTTDHRGHMTRHVARRGTPCSRVYACASCDSFRTWRRGEIKSHIEGHRERS